MRLSISRALALAALAALPASVVAQGAPAADTTSIPFDTAVTVGRLPNGLRYYIRANRKPEHRAELRLVVKVGSVLEDPDQRGLAHFIEHMAFNGTTHFAKNALVNYLESIGMQFGADLNAYTSFDETVYQLQVPTDSGSALEKGVQILDDWAEGQLLQPDEVKKERGVVIEEWRSRRGAGLRLAMKGLPVLLRGTPYPERIPIGSDTALQSFNDTSLARYYRQWYRPDLMAVVAVGDFDKARVEQLIRAAFANQKNPTNERPRPTFAVPTHDSTLINIATDKEATTTSVELVYKHPFSAERTVGDYRQHLIEALYNRMLNQRLSEITQKPNAPFVSAGSFQSRLFRSPTESYELNAVVREGEVERGLEAVLTEAERVDKFGFTQAELDRSRTAMLRGDERAFAERDKTESARYADSYVESFLDEEPDPGIATAWDLDKRFLPTIQLAEVNALARELITDKNRVVLVSAPDKPGVKLPTEAQILAVFDRVKQAQITPYTETVSDAPLVAKPPAPGTVAATKTVPEVGVTYWTLSNGVRVILKPTDYKADQILFSATSPGGSSLVSDQELRRVFLASQAIALGGVGSFSQIDLRKKLTGKVAGATPYIADTEEGMSGSASPKDVETMFQLIYLYFTQPRLDSSAFQAFRGNVKTFLVNRSNSPDQVFADTVQQTLTQHHPRALKTTAGLFDTLDLAESYRFYRERFADASDFTFAFVGNFSLDSIRPYVLQYLGSLPSLKRKETWRDVGIRPPTGVVERVVKKGIDPKSQTAIIFTGPATYAPESRYAIRALLDLAEIRLRDQLREELGGTYGVNVGGGISRVPRQSYQISISFGSAPDRVDQLVKAVFTQIDSLKTVPAKPEEIAKVKEQERRSRETQLKDNSYWVSNLLSRDQAGEDIRGLLAPYDKMIEALTPEQIMQAARKYFDTKNYVRASLYPENFTGATAK